MHLSPRLKKEEAEQPGIPTPKLVRKKKIGGKDEKPEDKRKITQKNIYGNSINRSCNHF